MKSSNVTVLAAAIGTSVLISTGTALSPASAAANEIVVVRGNTVETITIEPGTAPSALKTAVARGMTATMSEVPKPYRARGAPLAGGAPQALAGENIWLVDPEGDRLTACNLRDAINVGRVAGLVAGRRIIVCWSRAMPKDTGGHL